MWLFDKIIYTQWCVWRETSVTKFKTASLPQGPLLLGLSFFYERVLNAYFKGHSHLAGAVPDKSGENVHAAIARRQRSPAPLTGGAAALNVQQWRHTRDCRPDCGPETAQENASISPISNTTCVWWIGPWLMTLLHMHKHYMKNERIYVTSW